MRDAHMDTTTPHTIKSRDKRYVKNNNWQWQSQVLGDVSHGSQSHRPQWDH